jgi:hypothetical protein
MPAGPTYEPIATNTLGSATASVTFSTISGNYTDLVLVANGYITTGGQGIRIQFNGDTASNYSNTQLSGNGTSTSSTRDSNGTNARLTYEASWVTTTADYAQINLSIMNYSNATTYKTFLSRANRASGGVDAIVGLWRSTSAITSITIFPAANSFVTGSTFTLYGIKAA